MIASRRRYWIIPTLTTVIGRTGCGFTILFFRCSHFSPSAMVFFHPTVLPTIIITQFIPMADTLEALAAPVALLPPRVERARRVVLDQENQEILHLPLIALPPLLPPARALVPAEGTEATPAYGDRADQV